MPPVTINSEEELVALLKQQNKDSYDYLYKHYSAVLYGLILRVVNDEQTAQDVLQEAFVKIWRNINTYNADKGKIYTWMINIARNCAIDKMRSKGEVMKGKIHTGENIVDNIGNSAVTIPSTDGIGLKELVAELKEEHQKIVHLAYYKGFTLDEISKTLDIPLGTVKTRMRQAIKTLREHYSR